MDLAWFFDCLTVFLVQHPLEAPLFFILMHLVFAVCLLPCSPMALIAGALWGTWTGLLISVAAAFLSSCMTFGLSRFFLKERIVRFLSKRYPHTDWFFEQTKKHGWKFVAFIYLNPTAPASTSGYLFGLTKIDFNVYALLILVFMLPLQILLVVFGSAFTTSLLRWNLGMILVCLVSLTGVYMLCNYIIKRKKGALSE